MTDVLERRPVGRPATYTPDLGEQFCELYANGMKLQDIFKLPGMPQSHMMFAYWQDHYPDFSASFARARISRAEHLVDTMTDELSAYPDPQRARLAIQVRQWTASKWAPQYADKVQIDVDHKVSIGAALEAGLQRAVLPVRDQHQLTNSQAIEDAEYSLADATHQTSDDADDLPDWMS